MFGKIRNAADSAVSALAWSLGVKWLLSKVKAAANGNLGPGAYTFYWALAGAKTGIGFGVLILSILFAGFGFEDGSKWLVTIAGVAISAGLVDKAWRDSIPPAVRDSSVWRFLAENASLTTAAMGSALAYVTSTACAIHVELWRFVFTCEHATYVILGLGYVLAHFGLVDRAWRAAAPVKPEDLSPSNPLFRPKK